MLLSILIPTLVERKQQFDFIFNKLQNQITEFNLQDKVNIEFYCDNREKTIGFKRNQLLQNCKSEYACFLDDDDDINNKYVKLLVDGLNDKPDCLSLIGEITFDGQRPKKFIHSLKYKFYNEDRHAYYRPPNHLNVIKTSLSKQVLFPEKNMGEDTDWTMLLSSKRIIKTEKWIDETLYYYKFIGIK